jgi:hypothetical protein
MTVLVEGRQRLNIELFIFLLKLAATLVNRDGALALWTATSLRVPMVIGHEPINIDVVLLQLLVDL